MAPTAPPRRRRRASALAGEFVEKFADRIGLGAHIFPRSRQLFGLRVNVLAVEHLIGAFEQLADACAMQFQLQAAESQRADHDLAVTLLGLVGRLDAADAERRLRVAVGDQLDRRIVLPVRARRAAGRRWRLRRTRSARP